MLGLTEGIDVSQSKRNFLIVISLLLASIILLGCLPNKQGGFSCVCTPVISKIKSLIPSSKPKSPDTPPGQTPANSQPATGTGNAEWWKNQPDLKQEETAINSKISGLVSALNKKNTDASLNYFSPEERDKYRKVLSQSPASMSKMASDLTQARISYLSPDSTQYSRIAEYAIQVDGRTFYIEFIKTDGQWLLKTL